MIEALLNSKVETKSAEIGIGGFTLFARVRDVTSYASSAPTTYLEDGSPIQDHIINEPLKISIDGVVGDVYIQKSAIEKQINNVNNLLGKTSIYLPARTQSQLQQINALTSKFRDKVRQIDRLIETGESILNFGSQSSTKSNQEKFIDMMEAYHNAKALVVIDMPYRRLTQMRITDLSITKDATSGAISFKLSAQKIRFTQPVYTLNGALRKNPAGGIANQAGETADKGGQTGEKPSESLLSYGARILGL